MGHGHLRLAQNAGVPQRAAPDVELLHLKVFLGKPHLGFRWHLARWVAVADAAGQQGSARMGVIACLDLMVVRA